MRYLLDIHAKPPMVVLVSGDDLAIGATGQRYADQVGRPLVVATGPDVNEPTFRPTVPDAEPVVVPGASGVGVYERLPAPPATYTLAQVEELTMKAYLDGQAAAKSK